MTQTSLINSYVEWLLVLSCKSKHKFWVCYKCVLEVQSMFCGRELSRAMLLVWKIKHYGDSTPSFDHMPNFRIMTTRGVKPAKSLTFRGKDVLEQMNNQNTFGNICITGYYTLPPSWNAVLRAQVWHNSQTELFTTKIVMVLVNAIINNGTGSFVWIFIHQNLTITLLEILLKCEKEAKILTIFFLFVSPSW